MKFIIYQAVPGSSGPIPQQFFDVLPLITEANSTMAIAGSAIANELPDLRGAYFWYKGSYGPSPLCQPTNSYVILDQVQTVGEDQLRQLRKSRLRTPNGKLLVDLPASPILPRDGRRIYYSPSTINNNLGYSTAYAGA